MGCGVSKQPPPAQIPVKIPEDVNPALIPFYGISGSGELQREELETCLKAIGMRKSVLALAVDPMEQMGKSGKDTLSLPEWWEALNPRSKIVISSKLRSAGEDRHPTLFALACCVVGTGALRKSSATKADLSKALVELGMEEGSKLDAMLAKCKSEGPFQLDKWYAALSEAHAATIKGMLDNN